MFLHFQLVLDPEDNKFKLSIRTQTENTIPIIHQRISDPLDKTDTIDATLLSLLPKPSDIALLNLLSGIAVEVKEVTGITDEEVVARVQAEQAEADKAKAEAGESAEIIVEA